MSWMSEAAKKFATEDQLLISGTNANARVSITNSGASNSLYINHDTATSIAVNIDAENTTADAVNIAVDALTSGIGVDITSSSTGLTTAGNLLHVGATGDFNDAGGQVVEIESAHTTGTGLQLTMDAVTDGIGAYGTFDALTTGSALQLVSTSTALAAGELLKIDHTASGGSITAKTGALTSVAGSRTETRTSGTTADDYDAFSVTRTSIMNGAGGTLTAAGSVARFENVATQTAGTLTDSAHVLEVVQDTDSTGDAVNLSGGALVEAQETVTTGSPALAPYGATNLDSSGGAITGTLGSPSGTTSSVGQFKMIVMTDATTSSTISITNHETSDPEVATFDAVDEYWLGMWTGTEWVTVSNTCTFV